MRPGVLERGAAVVALSQAALLSGMALLSGLPRRTSTTGGEQPLL
ncbi:hypothetical protein [Amycolatopsis jiangsuensis]|uniref:Uncharacterized protein n=1 Tax=Amycolatopsis jiangsuensis TaxID=1181879 RepID=A0A840IQT9_9PSEU|nr:hypothetical protein [Amycolatopsis jiangsuensis]MBB4683815.1 hypothetical protein [Amycolatopsis jiangsuensis]